MTDPTIAPSTPSGRSLEQLASLATTGDRVALEELLAAIQHQIYRHALRFLGHPADAEDATQEILIRITTRLATFEHRSKFTTWAYTIATRMLIRTGQRRLETVVGSPDDYAAFLDAGLSEHGRPADEAERRELEDEVRISCTYGMLLALTRPSRAAYLLGDVLGFTDTEGAAICECSPAAFRQRLARARTAMRRIIDDRCGLLDPANPCSCARQITPLLDHGIINPDQLTFRDHPREPGQRRIDAARFERAATQLDHVVAIADLYRADRFAAPDELWATISTAIPDLLDTNESND